MDRFGYLFTSHTATVILLGLLILGEGGSGLVLHFSKDWADDVRLVNSVVSVVFLILLHNRDYRGVQKRVEEDEADEEAQEQG